MSKSITQDMAYRQSLMKYAEKYGVQECWSEVQQKSFIYLLLEAALGRKCRVPCLPFPPPGKPLPRHAENGDVSCKKAQAYLQTEALRADDTSGRTGAGGVRADG